MGATESATIIASRRIASGFYKQRGLGSISMELETAVESMSMTTVEGTTPAIAVAASSPDTLALAAQCPFIQQIVILTGDAQAVSNTLAPFMALANSTTAPRSFQHRARMAVAGVASFQPGTGDIEIAPQSPEPVHVPIAGAETPAGPEEAVKEGGPAAPASAPEGKKGEVPAKVDAPETKDVGTGTLRPGQATKKSAGPEEASKGTPEPEWATKRTPELQQTPQPEEAGKETPEPRQASKGAEEGGDC
ncbi:hypothetical protein COCOBI_18-1420 [Coccomyxa sp. Obi]|nr:hypothetical protein COCOBI_18-1420 [Coccomyxa sp. Obi]